MRCTWTRALLALLVGCGGGASSTRATEFLPTDDVLFDEGMDLVDDPVIIEGEWIGHFEQRVDRADLIVEVQIESLSSDVDLDRRASYRLNARVRDQIKGKRSDALLLRVSDRQRGYDSIRANEDRLLRDPFVAFVKWQADEITGKVEPRWHLSPASQGVKKKIAQLMRPPVGESHTEVEVIRP